MARPSFFATACAVVFTCMAACAQTAAPSAKPSAVPLAVTTGNAGPAKIVSAPAQSTPKITYTDVNVDGPYIAMTFDDGPSAANTPKLLDLAAKQHIKLTVFLVGE